MFVKLILFQSQWPQAPDVLLNIMYGYFLWWKKTTKLQNLEKNNYFSLMFGNLECYLANYLSLNIRNKILLSA